MTPLKKLLTGTTALSHPAHLVRDPGTIGAFLVNAVAGAGTVAATSFAAMAVGYIATTVVTSWAMSALTPKPNLGSAMQGTLVNARDPASPQEYVYGTVRKGGIVTYIEATGATNQFLHMIICLAGHEVSSIGDIYINDEVVTLDGSGFVTSQNWARSQRPLNFWQKARRSRRPSSGAGSLICMSGLSSIRTCSRMACRSSRQLSAAKRSMTRARHRRLSHPTPRFACAIT
jgi:hypothetical protein